MEMQTITERITINSQKLEASLDQKIQTRTKGLDKNSAIKQLLLEMCGSECTVCLDAPCDQVFLDCMHICVCAKCSHLFKPKSQMEVTVVNEDNDDNDNDMESESSNYLRTRTRPTFRDEENEESSETSAKCPRCRATIREVRPIRK